MKLLKRIINIVKPQDANEAALYMLTVFLFVGFAIIGNLCYTVNIFKAKDMKRLEGLLSEC
jgi:Na+/pantothenate symporter